MGLPFPEAAIGPLVFLTIGFLIATVIALTAYILKINKEIEKEQSANNPLDNPKIDNLGLGNTEEEILKMVLNYPETQNKLPNKLSKSKSTISNAVNKLEDENYIKREEKGKTYLIKPKRKEIEEEQERR